MTNERVVEVTGLRKAYRGGAEAVRGIDFEIRRGETFALLGPNGAGKSTTIEILEGYRSRSGGEVRVLGEDPATAPRRWKARLGMVRQASDEPGTVTVREQLRHFARYTPHPRDVDEILAAVGLTEKADTRIARLSGGQRRRVDVALGVLGDPELLFLDEPTTGFDPEARRQFWELIRSLRDRGTTVLLTTHYLDEAAQLSDRAGVIAGGRIVAYGAIDELGGAAARIPVVRWHEGGVLREERTERPGELVARLAAAGEPDRLEVVRPSLEDIYLGLVAAADAASAAEASGEVAA